MSGTVAAIIPAGGEGSRLGPAKGAEQVPKALRLLGRS